MIHKCGLAMGLLAIFSEKSILLNGLAVVWPAFLLELRELIHRIGLAMGLLPFLLEAEKSILLSVLAVDWLVFLSEIEIVLMGWL